MTGTAHSATAYKILTVDQWAQFQADGMFHGAPVDLADGYIHLSAEPQVAGTLDKHFAEQSGLWLARVDLTVLGGEERRVAFKLRQAQVQLEHTLNLATNAGDSELQQYISQLLAQVQLN